MMYGARWKSSWRNKELYPSKSGIPTAQSIASKSEPPKRHFPFAMFLVSSCPLSVLLGQHVYVKLLHHPQQCTQTLEGTVRGHTEHARGGSFVAHQQGGAVGMEGTDDERREFLVNGETARNDVGDARSGEGEGNGSGGVS